MRLELDLEELTALDHAVTVIGLTAELQLARGLDAAELEHTRNVLRRIHLRAFAVDEVAP